MYFKNIQDLKHEEIICHKRKSRKVKSTISFKVWKWLKIHLKSRQSTYTYLLIYCIRHFCTEKRHSHQHSGRIVVLASSELEHSYLKFTYEGQLCTCTCIYLHNLHNYFILCKLMMQWILRINTPALTPSSSSLSSLSLESSEPEMLEMSPGKRN